jgi:hypothetical protein
MNGTATITIDGTAILEVLDRRGWTKKTFGYVDTGPVCLYGAIRLCAPVKGDAFLIEQVMARRGRGTDWNDELGTTLEMVREFAAAGLEITDDDLAETFGPNWQGVVVLVREAATMTARKLQKLDVAVATLARAARATRYVAGYAAWYAARDAARNVAGYVAGYAAWYAARDAAGDAARDAAGDAARDAAGDAAIAIVTYDLAGTEGYTVEHRELLLAPWESVMGNAARQAIGKGRET